MILSATAKPTQTKEKSIKLVSDVDTDTDYEAGFDRLVEDVRKSRLTENDATLKSVETDSTFIAPESTTPVASYSSALSPGTFSEPEASYGASYKLHYRSNSYYSSQI